MPWVSFFFNLYTEQHSDVTFHMLDIDYATKEFRRSMLGMEEIIADNIEKKKWKQKQIAA